MNISESDFRQSTYFIESAKLARVGKEWNNNIWDSKNNPMGYHALYYRTDKSECRAVLHMIDGNLEILPDRIYFIPAYSVLHSEIDGEMEKYYVHFQSDFIDFGLLIPSYERCFVPADNMTKGLFDIIVKNCKNTDMASERKVQGAMNILLADLLENMAVKQRDEKKFEKVLKYIQEHYRERIEVGDLATEALMETLDHEKVNVRCDATRALGEIGNPKAVDKIIVMLKDEWVNVRIYAVTSLGKLGDKKAVPALIEVMKNEQENDLVRAGAAAALGVLRDQRALLPLRELIMAAEELGELEDTALKSFKKIMAANWQAIPGASPVKKAN